MRYFLFLFLLVLSGCATNITVQGTVPTPLIAKVPLRVGVYYSPDFKNFRHQEVIEKHATYNVAFGHQNLNMFRSLFAAMFKSVVEVGKLPLTVDQAKGLDGIIVPEILKYGFLTPDISGLNFYSASIRYRITLYSGKGKMLHQWILVGYGKSEAGIFGGNEALADSTLQAIRDGGARISIDIPKDPAFVAWVRENTGNAGKAGKAMGKVDIPSPEGGQR